MDKVGVLYGAAGGGIHHNGVVFALVPPTAPGGAWTERVLHYFGRSGDGSGPAAGLAFGPHRELYGTTYLGGTFNLGTVFELTRPTAPGGTWTEDVIYNFGSQPGDGGGPGGPLLVDKSGNLFGAAWGNGTTTPGTVFELSPPTATGGNWTFTVLYSFPPGQGLGARLTMDSNGNLYSTTLIGGSGVCPGEGGCGSVFELTPPTTPGGAWTETTLYSFTGQNGDGALPETGVILDSNGTLYGTTAFGGPPSSIGTLFWLTPPTTAGSAWTETSIAIGAENDTPFARLTFGPKGIIYGAGVVSVFQVSAAR